MSGGIGLEHRDSGNSENVGAVSVKVVETKSRYFVLDTSSDRNPEASEGIEGGVECGLRFLGLEDRPVYPTHFV